MFGIGLPELILIMAVALIVVGPEKLPELAKSLAKGVMELKKTANALKESLNEEDEDTPWDHIEPDAYPPTRAHPLPPPPPERTEEEAGADQKDTGPEQDAADDTGHENTGSDKVASSEQPSSSSEEPTEK